MVPGVSRTIPISVVAAILIGIAWTGVTLASVGLLSWFSGGPVQPPASLHLSTTELSFGGVVTGGTATSELTIGNPGSPNAPDITIEQIIVTGQDASLFTVVAGSDAVVPAGDEGIITVAFSPDSV